MTAIHLCPCSHAPIPCFINENICHVTLHSKPCKWLQPAVNSPLPQPPSSLYSACYHTFPYHESAEYSITAIIQTSKYRIWKDFKTPSKVAISRQWYPSSKEGKNNLEVVRQCGMFVKYIQPSQNLYISHSNQAC